VTSQTKPDKVSPLMRALREIRYIHRMSQRAFAEFIGVPRGRLATIETGYSRPSDGYLEPIARTAGVTVEEFREGIIAVNQCGSCKGSGVVRNKKRKVKKLRPRDHPRTPTIPPDEARN